MAFLEGSRSVAEGSEPVAVEASETFHPWPGGPRTALVTMSSPACEASP